jgi:hypothetical protein
MADHHERKSSTIWKLMQYLIQSNAARCTAEFHDGRVSIASWQNSGFVDLKILIGCCIAKIEPIQLRRSSMIASVSV